MSKTARRRTFEIVKVATRDDRASRTFDVFLVALIVLNVLAVCLETVQPIGNSWRRAFGVFEIVSVVVFSIEYLLRVWTAVEDERFSAPISGRLRFMLTPMAIVDLLAIIPFYAPILIPMDLRFLRALRLIRILRLLKLGRYSRAMQTIARVVIAKKEELAVTAFVVFILLLLGSAGLYYAEHDVQPEAISSIPAAMWWGVVTLSTVGYGDIVPVTQVGKLLGAMVALLGIGMFALPTGILGAAFVEEVRKGRGRPSTCPHCGHELPSL